MSVKNRHERYTPIHCSLAMVPLKVLALHITASPTEDIIFTEPEIKPIISKKQTEGRLMTADLTQSGVSEAE